MSKPSPKAPQPPDPVATAQAQQAANVEAAREQARLSQFNQITPFGTLTFTGEIGTPERTATTTFDPVAQQQLEAQRQIGLGLTEFAGTQLGGIQEALGQPLSFEGLPGLQGAGDAAREQAQSAVFERGQNLLAPNQTEQRRQLEVSLANRGIPIGSPAYNEALRRLDQQQALERENLALRAVEAGGAEQQRQFGLSQAARQQGLSELLQQRAQPINELAALLGRAPQVTTPGFQQFQQQGVQPADVLGAQQLGFAGQQNAFNQQLAQQQALQGGLFGLGAAGVGSVPFFFI